MRLSRPPRDPLIPGGISPGDPIGDRVSVRPGREGQLDALSLVFRQVQVSSNHRRSSADRPGSGTSYRRSLSRRPLQSARCRPRRPRRSNSSPKQTSESLPGNRRDVEFDLAVARVTSASLRSSPTGNRRITRAGFPVGVPKVVSGEIRPESKEAMKSIGSDPSRLIESRPLRISRSERQ